MSEHPSYVRVLKEHKCWGHACSGQTGSSPVKSTGGGPGSVKRHFTTEKGSHYERVGAGTKRYKAKTGEAFEASDKTVYLTEQTAGRAQAIINTFDDEKTSARPRILPDGRIAIVVKDRKTGKVRDDLSKIVAGEDHPKPGLHPFEVWHKNKAGERKWHFGHAVQKSEVVKKKKKKRTYAHMLKGYQSVPMDLDKINASFEATQKKE